jgi:hypothetical protein
VIFESSWRTEPAAAFLGLANSGSPRELAFAEEDLTSDLDGAGQPAGRRVEEAKRKGPYRPQVRRDVLAGGAVTARRAVDEDSVLVSQADRQAVNLEFGDVVYVLRLGQRQEILHALVEGEQFVAVEGIGEAEHGVDVGDSAERLQRRCTHPLCRRVGGAEFGIALFEFNQAAEEAVVFRVADFRRIEDVIAVIVVVYLLAQMLDFLANFVGGHGWLDVPTDSPARLAGGVSF